MKWLESISCERIILLMEILSQVSSKVPKNKFELDRSDDAIV